MITADIGARTTAEILERIRQRVERHQVADSAQLRSLIKEHLLEILEATERPLPHVAEPPRVIMVVGVNGAGKTTSIGKLTRRLQSEGKTVLLCAADTFRAAAIEQLEVWAQRAGADLIRQQPGSDPSAVLFDALTAGKARKVDVVIADTAGRLHTKVNLMAELEKMRRTAARVIPEAPHEVLLVMEATTGQNGLEQARKFTESSAVTGIILTKLDGTAKGGVVVAISRELQICRFAMSAWESRSTICFPSIRKRLYRRCSINMFNYLATAPPTDAGAGDLGRGSVRVGQVCDLPSSCINQGGLWHPLP